MTTKKIIDGLYFTVGMMLFNPATGESKTPDELNEDDRYTYDACMGAIDLLKAQEPVEPTLRGGIGGYWYCGACNYQISRGDKFCRYCGQEVKWE